LGDALNRVEYATAGETWALVQRIVASRQLQKAPQLREIFLYIGRRALIEDATAVSEQEIGCNVLGRGRAFNPNDDNIVRVQVRHLRQKLEEYFNSEGADESLVLTIPKGGYVPRVEPRTSSPTPAAIKPTVEPASAPNSIAEATAAAEAPVAPRPATHPWWVFALLLAFVIGLVGGTLLLRSEPGILDKTKAADEVRSHRGSVLWSRLFVPGQETNIVMADSSLVAVQDVLDADIPLADYFSGAYPEKLIENVSDKHLQTALRLIASRQYTSWGDADIVSRLMNLSHQFTAPINVCYSRFISSRELKSENAILIGSRRGIPWEQLFEPQLNFALEEDHATGQYYFRNKAPTPDEQPVYRPSAGRDADTYADIAILPNLASTGTVLILAGIDMAATQAAGEMVSSPDFGSVLNKMLRSRKNQAPAFYIEMLMQARAVAGGSQGKILAYRLLPGKPVGPG
jgi:hypothetical protein